MVLQHRGPRTATQEQFCTRQKDVVLSGQKHTSSLKDTFVNQNLSLTSAPFIIALYSILCINFYFLTHPSFIFRF